MPFSLFGCCNHGPAGAVQTPPRPGQGKRRGVTQSPRRAKRRNRRKP